MKDRLPLYPGRVKLVPVPGQENVYDMIRADQPTQDGDPLNKATLLKDATAALFGLGSDAVPNDVFAVLSRFHAGLGNEYLWEKQEISYETELGAEITTGPMYFPVDIKYGDEIQILDGVVSIKNPTETQISNTESANAIVGKYAIFPSSSIVDPQTVYQVNTPGGIGSNYVSYRLKQVLSMPIVQTVGYVNSPSQDAYPPAEHDDYIYAPIGRIGDRPQIEAGSYIGTGTYGINLPNSLTFGFIPKFVFVCTSGGSGGQLMGIFSPWAYPDSYVNGGYKCIESAGVVGGYAKLDGNTLMWYYPSGYAYQLNSKDTYNYIAIG